MASAGDALKRKALIISELAEKLRPESIDRAALDHHARRRPIPCGMTIHTGVGCSYGCVYCYLMKKNGLVVLLRKFIVTLVKSECEYNL